MSSRSPSGKHSISSSDPELVSSVYGESDPRFEAVEQHHLRTPLLTVVKRRSEKRLATTPLTNWTKSSHTLKRFPTATNTKYRRDHAHPRSP